MGGLAHLRPPTGQRGRHPAHPVIPVCAGMTMESSRTRERCSVPATACPPGVLVGGGMSEMWGMPGDPGRRS
ncbi:MAG TPA: hypothetical protein DCY89_00095 [Gammaproteobacteria bacterium]|nr:hypothetical protein [Gammaproteobacteria bacterium]